MKQYVELLEHIIKNGVEAEDRTGVGTLSTFGYQMRFDLGKGFPLVTVKKTLFKGVFAELLWFIEGSTDERRLAELTYSKPREELVGKTTIWTENADNQGVVLGYPNNNNVKGLGPVYGSMWRYWYTPKNNNIIEVKRKTHSETFEDLPIVWLDKIECDLNTENMWAVGEQICGKNKKYKFQTSSGFVGEITRPNWRSLQSHKKVDGYYKGVFGVGYLGNVSNIKNDRLYNMWYNMMARCYNEKSPVYKHYGGAGVVVSKEWHSFERFKNTIYNVPFYHLWLENNLNMELDKDYYDSGVYSKDTCIFLEKRLNVSVGDQKCIVVGGKRYKSIAHYKDIHGNKPKSSSILVPKEGYIFRKEVFVDQLKWVINEIKTNPSSRRLILSSWNVNEIKNMALPPCHTMFQFYVQNGKLSCQLYQRSGDSSLGIPYNIASYAFLTHLIANVCDLEVGDFVHTIGDAHIYSNHVEKTLEFMKNEPKELPTIKIEKSLIEEFKKVVFEGGKFSLDSISKVGVEGYDSHPFVKLPMAV